ncbi:MAG: DNA polymerase IV [Bacteroidales bacterium]|nr:DNA polymerase IV [Candidatus Latescibacterota bacterium]
MTDESNNDNSAGTDYSDGIIRSNDRNVYPAGSGEWGPGERVIAHIDMDAFFASVEVLDFPELRGKPVVVGGSSNRGVVSAASYRAREFGIHSAMPIFQAKRLCSGLVIQPGRMKRYSELSHEVMKTLYSYSPLVQQISIDEAYVDLSGTEKLFGRPEETAFRIKKDIFGSTSLTCSVGLSVSKLVAKISSDMNKPDGVTIIPPERVMEFISSLPVGKIPGIGSKSEEELAKTGIKKVGDIGRLAPKFVRERYGKFGERLMSIAAGKAGGEVVPFSPPKSISNEITLSEDTDEIELLEKHLMELSEKVGRRLRKNYMRGRTVTLKLKDSRHRLITRSVTLARPTCQGKKIYTEAKELMEALGIGARQRLIGVGVSNLSSDQDRGLSWSGKPEQGLLFAESDPGEERWDKLDRVMDGILDRFGKGAVKRGRLNE